MDFEELKILTEAYSEIKILSVNEKTVNVEFSKTKKPQKGNSLEELGYSFEMGM